MSIESTVDQRRAIVYNAVRLTRWLDGPGAKPQTDDWTYEKCGDDDQTVSVSAGANPPVKLHFSEFTEFLGACLREFNVAPIPFADQSVVVDERKARAIVYSAIEAAEWVPTAQESETREFSGVTWSYFGGGRLGATFEDVAVSFEARGLLKLILVITTACAG